MATSVSNDDEKAEEKSQFRKHDKVILKGLRSKPHWNNIVAKIIGPFSESRKRWPVQLVYDNEKHQALIKTNNLVLKLAGSGWSAIKSPSIKVILDLKDPLQYSLDNIASFIYGDYHVIETTTNQEFIDDISRVQREFDEFRNVIFTLNGYGEINTLGKQYKDTEMITSLLKKCKINLRAAVVYKGKFDYLDLTSFNIDHDSFYWDYPLKQIIEIESEGIKVIVFKYTKKTKYDIESYYY